MGRFSFRRLIPYFAVLFGFYVLSRSLYYLGEEYSVWPAANALAIADRVFGSITIVPPMVSWFIMGFILGATVYFVIWGAHRTARLHNRRMLWIGAAVAFVAISTFIGPRLEFAVAGRMYLRPHVRNPFPGQIKTFQNIEFVWIPPGRFRMGSLAAETGRDEDEQAHIVTITRGFWLSRYEITQGQWRYVTESSPFSFSKDVDGAVADELPAENITWDMAREFAQRLNNFTVARPFRLPTEAEWEYACRAGSTSAYSYGNDPGQLVGYAWYEANSPKQPQRVGQKPPNAWGLYDMHGNVWEWCLDFYADYPAERVIDPYISRAARRGGLHPLRGGGWRSKAEECRSARRFLFLEGQFARPDDVGFRLLREFQPADLNEGDDVSGSGTSGEDGR
jgi:formylglycine-generating enzyme required for sulfatase activity